MGDGKFILAVNAGMRKAIGKRNGTMVKVQLDVDDKPRLLNKEFLSCLDDAPAAKKYFATLPESHKHYFSKWVTDAKTELTRVKRIAAAVNALSVRNGFSEMMKQIKKDKDLLFNS